MLGVGVDNSREELLIARLQVEELIVAAEWEGAAEVGTAVTDCDQTSTPEHLRIACSLASLGLVGNINATTTFPPLLRSNGLGPTDLAKGVTAMKLVAEDDSDTFLSALFAALLEVSSLANRLTILDAAAALADGHVAELMLASPLVEVALRATLSDPDIMQRGRGLLLVGTLLRAAPAALCARLVPVLTVAALVELQPLQALTLATLGDISFALAHVLASDPLAAAATEQLTTCMKLLSTYLYAPSLQLQNIAALALSKIALTAACALQADTPNVPKDRRPEARRAAPPLDDPDFDSESEREEEEQEQYGGASATDGRSGGLNGSIFLASIDTESVIADLAFRYTSQQPGTVPKAEESAHKVLMMSMLACFEALLAAQRTAELSNTAVWVLLGAAEEGMLDALRDSAEYPHATPIQPLQMDEVHTTRPQPFAPPLPPQQHDQLQQEDGVLDPRTLRCLRFLTSLVAGNGNEGAGARRAIVRNLCEAASINLQLEHGLKVEVSRVAHWLGVAGV